MIFGVGETVKSIRRIEGSDDLIADINVKIKESGYADVSVFLLIDKFKEDKYWGESHEQEIKKAQLMGRLEGMSLKHKYKFSIQNGGLSVRFEKQI